MTYGLFLELTFVSDETKIALLYFDTMQSVSVIPRLFYAVLVSLGLLESP